MHFNRILLHLLHLFVLLSHCFSSAPNRSSSVELCCFLKLHVCFFHRLFSSSYQSHFAWSLRSALCFLRAAKCPFFPEKKGGKCDEEREKKKRKNGMMFFQKRRSGKHKKKGREVRRTACLVTALCRWTCQVAHWIAATHTQTTREQNSDKVAHRKYSILSYF